MKKQCKLIVLFFTVFYLCNISKSFAVINNTLRDKGKLLVQSLYVKKDIGIPRSSNAYLESILAIMHYITSRVPAKNKQILFKSGAILLEDADWELFNFLKGYVAKKTNDLRTERMMPNSSAYPRKSTHFNTYYLYTGKAKNALIGVTKTNHDFVHFGIDMKQKIGVLPIENKAHILFGKVDTVNGKPILFIKFEEFGLKGSDAFQHGWNLVKHKIKSTPRNLYSYRRETIPPVFVKDFAQLLSARDSGFTDKRRKKDIRNKAQALGIKQMMKFAQEWLDKNMGSSAWRKAVKAFIAKIKKQYPHDWQMRFGNEVIIFQDDLFTAS